jgi:hypothetical protein
MEHRWNEIDTEKTEVLGQKPVPVPLCPPKIPHGLTQNRTPVWGVTQRRVVVIDVSGQPIGHIIKVRASCLTLDGVTDMLSRNVDN